MSNEMTVEFAETVVIEAGSARLASQASTTANDVPDFGSYPV
jgi:hypothetical protein